MVKWSRIHYNQMYEYNAEAKLSRMHTPTNQNKQKSSNPPQKKHETNANTRNSRGRTSLAIGLSVFTKRWSSVHHSRTQATEFHSHTMPRTSIQHTQIPKLHQHSYAFQTETNTHQSISVEHNGKWASCDSACTRTHASDRLIHWLRLLRNIK